MPTSVSVNPVYPIAPNATKFLGTTTPLQQSPPNSTPNMSGALAQQVITPGGASSLSQTTAVPQTGQAATTPPQNFNQATTAQDAYRFGNFQSSSTDPLINTRVLGDQDDIIASISLSSDASLNANSVPTQGDVLSAYSRFFLERVSEAQTEKFQIVETFTAFYTFFYGKRPPIYTFQGTLLNDQNHKWTNDLMFYYENFLRGTRAVELNAQAVLAYDGRFVSGFLLNLNIQQNATIHKGASFSVDVLVTDHRQLYLSADIDTLLANSQAQLAAAQAQINQQISGIGMSSATLPALQISQGALPNAQVSVSGAASTTPPVSVSASNTQNSQNIESLLTQNSSSGATFVGP